MRKIKSAFTKPLSPSLSQNYCRICPNQIKYLNSIGTYTYVKAFERHKQESFHLSTIDSGSSLSLFSHLQRLHTVALQLRTSD
ncbi:hypothetical protein Leryth_018577 [Lithospermum erythrorhizon]|nr:hypothetical protein Leryth_018577 [Lithospermum erythrorhizon]